MAIYVPDLRTPSMKARWAASPHTMGIYDCELCRKPIKPGRGVGVAIDHEHFEFVTEAEAAERGDAVSIFDLGADCAKLVAKALKASGAG